MRFRGAWLVFAVVLSVTGCTGAGVVSVPQLTTILNSIDDVSGDAPANTTSGTAYDILKVETRRIDTPPFGSYDTLRVDIQFAQEPLLPPPGSFASLGTQLVFRIYFDTDQSAATGVWYNGMCGNPPGGSDFIVNATHTSDPFAPVAAQPRIAPSGNYEVVDGTQKTGEASVNIVGNTLQVTVPLSALGNDDGIANVSVRVGNAADWTTDCAPKAAGFITTGQGATR